MSNVEEAKAAQALSQKMAVAEKRLAALREVRAEIALQDMNLMAAVQDAKAAIEKADLQAMLRSYFNLGELL
jgi:hypothetical protein